MYVRIGQSIASISTPLIFIAVWIFCAVHYGFLFGVGFGWLPALIVALFLRLLIIFGWAVLAAPIAAMGLIWLFLGSGKPLVGLTVMVGAIIGCGFMIEWLVYRLRGIQRV